MSQDYQSQFYTITHALENNNLLAFNEKKGEFEEVGYLGRAWRSLSKLMGNKDAFKDCYAPMVGNKIVEFINNNKTKLYSEDRDTLANDLDRLREKLYESFHYKGHKTNYLNIVLNVESIREIEKSEFKPKEPPTT